MMFNLIKKYTKLLIFTIILLATTNLYADPDPEICTNPLDPNEIVDCGDVDLAVPLDSNLYILMGITVIGVFYTFRKKVILT